MQRILLVVILIAFSALTGVAVLQHGVIAIFQTAFATTSGMQLFADLVIALTLFMVWLWNDAKATGRNALPWIVLTLAIGSFGPLLYLLTRKAPAREL